MKLLLVIAIWIVLLALVALVAVLLESRMHRRQWAREEALYRRLGVEAPTWERARKTARRDQSADAAER